MQAIDNSECLEKFLKFKAPERIEPLIQTAINFKKRFDFTNRKDSKANRILEVHAKSIPMNTNWLLNASPVKVSKEEAKNAKSIELSEEKLKIIESIKSCIEFIETEKKHYNADNMDTCIKLLKEITEELD